MIWGGSAAYPRWTLRALSLVLRSPRRTSGTCAPSWPAPFPTGMMSQMSYRRHTPGCWPCPPNGAAPYAPGGPSSSRRRAMSPWIILRRRELVSLDALPEINATDVVLRGSQERRPDEIVNLTQERRLLAGVIASLPEKCRQVLILRKIHGLSHKEIAPRHGDSGAHRGEACQSRRPALCRATAPGDRYHPN